MALSKLRLGQLKPADGTTTLGDVHFPKVKWLSSFNGSNGATSTTDSSNSNLSLSFQGSSVISTAQSKFGGSSLYAPNSNPTGVYVSGAGSTINLTGDFTFEWWFYRIQETLALRHVAGFIYGQSSLTNCASYGMLVGYRSASYTDRATLYASSNGSSWNITQGVALGQSSDNTLGTIGQWVHMALTRSGTTWNYYIDGTRTYTGELGSSTISAPGTYIHVGKSWANGSQMEGYWDDFRVTQGLARYTTTSFTPPTTAHLTSAGDVNKHIIVNSDADGVAIGTGAISSTRIAKAWVKFDGSAAAASMIQSSYNVSSMTDNGTGRWAVNFTTAMSDSDYSAVASFGGNSGYSSSVGCARIGGSSTASLVQVSSSWDSSGTHTYYDFPQMHVQVFGN